MPEIIKLFIASFDISHTNHFSKQKVFEKHISVYEKHIKTIFDFVFSGIFILFLLPVFLVISVAIKITSKGSVIYKQERIGKYGKPFIIYKFRSMHTSAEKNGPELSPINDARVTRVGRFLRSSKLDEIPQFFNVLKGDMSLVGPRPERKFYIDQILEQKHDFKRTFEVKPGITSLGQIKYGYANSVNQTLDRYKYDLYYLNNRGTYLDIKILFQTAMFLVMFNKK